MNGGQYDGIMRMLTQIRDRLPVGPETTVVEGSTGRRDYSRKAAVDVIADKVEAKRQEVDVILAPLLAVTRDEQPARTAEEVLAARMPDAVALGHRQALSAFLGVLDDWINGARDNHLVMEHRGESTDDRCWTRFHPQDIRKMVNDTAREMGIPEFPVPAQPLEEAL